LTVGIGTSPKLAELKGLESLKSIDWLTIDQAPLLTSLAPLDGLESIVESATITLNPLLPTCEIAEFLRRTGSPENTVSGNAPCE
jgi:methyl coenzyme M reductase subunit C-like uncharacterized protein (methanogenesis marker protein 7)